MELEQEAAAFRCPKCQTMSQRNALASAGYLCPGCQVEAAHLDMAPNGSIRGLFGWLKQPDEILLNRYRVLSLLGKGGFAATYLVEDTRLKGKRRAIKEVPDLLYDERETEILSRLEHPAIPDIIDRSVVDGMSYLVLELAGSTTLEGVRQSAGGRLALGDLVPRLEELCDILQYLHSQKPPIIHRDLKPENILLNEQGRVMLIDFGIAKESAPQSATRTVARSASFGFSPPEQVLGSGTDERSDVYALGATAYLLLTGVLPSPAHERVAGADLVVPTQLVPTLPANVDAALVKALDLNANRRQQTVEEFRAQFFSTAAIAQPSAHRPTPAQAGGSRTVLIDAGNTAAAQARAAGAREAVHSGIAPARRGRRVSGVLTAALIVLGVGIASVGIYFARSGSGPVDDTAGKAAPASPLEATTGVPGPNNDGKATASPPVSPPAEPVPEMQASRSPQPPSTRQGSALGALSENRAPTSEVPPSEQESAAPKAKSKSTSKPTAVAKSPPTTASKGWTFHRVPDPNSPRR